MIRKIITIGMLLAVLLIAYNLLVQITDALKQGDRLSQAADAVYKLEIKNRELKQKLAQIQSPEFVESQARDKLGLGKPYETTIIIPDDKLKSVLGASEAAQIVRLPNWLGWWKVFFR